MARPAGPRVLTANDGLGIGRGTTATPRNEYENLSLRAPQRTRPSPCRSPPGGLERADGRTPFYPVPVSRLGHSASPRLEAVRVQRRFVGRLAVEDVLGRGRCRRRHPNRRPDLTSTSRVMRSPLAPPVASDHALGQRVAQAVQIPGAQRILKARDRRLRGQALAVDGIATQQQLPDRIVRQAIGVIASLCYRVVAQRDASVMNRKRCGTRERSARRGGRAEAGHRAAHAGATASWRPAVDHGPRDRKESRPPLQGCIRASRRHPTTSQGRAATRWRLIQGLQAPQARAAAIVRRLRQSPSSRWQSALPRSRSRS